MLFGPCSHRSSAFQGDASRQAHCLKEVRARVVEADVELTSLRLILEEVPCQATSRLESILQLDRARPGSAFHAIVLGALTSIGGCAHKQRSPLITCACAATSGGSPTAALYASAFAICVHRLNSDTWPMHTCTNRSLCVLAPCLQPVPMHRRAAAPSVARRQGDAAAHRSVRYLQTDGWGCAGCC